MRTDGNGSGFGLAKGLVRIISEGMKRGLVKKGIEGLSVTDVHCEGREESRRRKASFAGQQSAAKVQ